MARRLVALYVQLCHNNLRSSEIVQYLYTSIRRGRKRPNEVIRVSFAMSRMHRISYTVMPLDTETQLSRS